MKLGEVVARGVVVFAAVAVACSSDDDDSANPSVMCGEGTVLKDNVCVAAGGSSATGGDTAVAGKSTTAGTHEGGSAGTAGSGTAGTMTEGGTGAGVAGETSVGGEGGGAGMGPEPQPEIEPTRWLVFAHEKGTFAYDTTKFPSADGLLTLSSALSLPRYFNVIWSPNGRDVLYLDAGSVYAVNMQGDAPGTPRVLLSTPAAPSAPPYLVSPWAWSADSASLAAASKTTLSVLDASQAAPALHPITTTVQTYRWAPAGSWLYFKDADGEHVVEVVNGTPGSVVDLTPKDNVWSPDGVHLAGLLNDEVALTTLANHQATVDTLTDFNPEPPINNGGEAGAAGAGGAPALPDPVGFVNLQFNKDGSRLAFSSEESDPEAYIVRIKPTMGQPEAVVSNAPADASVYCTSWSPDGTLLLCEWSKIGAGEVFAASATGGAPITVLEDNSYNSWTWSPSPAKHQLFNTKLNQNNMLEGLMVDLAKPNTAVKLYTAPAQYTVSPTGDFLSYVVKPTVNIVNLAKPQNQPTPIDTDHLAYDPPVATWSPDARFISIADGAFQQRLVRVDGESFSTPVKLQVTSKYAIWGAWQP